MSLSIREVGFYYNLHVNVEAFTYSMLTIRKYMPYAPIQLVTDRDLPNLETYKTLSEVFSLPITVRNIGCTYINGADDLDLNIAKMYEWFDRMYLMCELLNTKYVVRMEDDVHLRGPITKLPTTHAGGSHKDTGMGGGTIFERKAFMELYRALDYDYIDKKCRENETNNFAGDGVLRWMFTEHGYTYSKWQDITEDWHDQDKNAALHHGDKSLYDREYLKRRGIAR